ncbi:hypothetical protein MPDQ_000062 [Monascus purpureus]|uniref:DUF985 domain-containing protein n=1 Tax=Monascus purpureus TaxID=5098 RepID=A0A507R6T4_MONPU|nr:hypothetical protein MPDQ_000062 [Monascus purpureus]
MATDIPISQIKPIYPIPDNSTARKEAPSIQKTIQTLHLIPHIEGGYFVETDRDPLRIPNPFLSQENNYPTTAAAADNTTRSASTSIFYYLTPGSPLGAFHRNRGRTVHTLHWGRGRYVLIHADEVVSSGDGDGKETVTGKARIETFLVGPNIERGEKLQWVVEGGKFKGTYLLPDEEGDPEKKSEGLLISETVVPGFEYSDHDFLRVEMTEQLLTPEQVDELKWMLRKVD